MSPTRRASSTVSNLRSAVTAGGPQAAPPPIAPDPKEEAAAPDPALRPEPAAAPAPDPAPATAAPAEAAPVRLRGPKPRPPKPIRFTLDLNQDRHSFLKRFALEAEVDAALVMRMLLDQLRSDEDLAERLRQAAWEAE